MRQVIIAYRAGDAESSALRLSADLATRDVEVQRMLLEAPETEESLQTTGPETVLLVMVGPRWSTSGLLTRAENILAVAQSRGLQIIGVFCLIEDLPPLLDLPLALRPHAARTLSFWLTREAWADELTTLINVIKRPTSARIVRIEPIEAITYKEEVAVVPTDDLDRQLVVGRDTYPPPPPLIRSDDVRCSVFAPLSVRTGNAILVQVFAHLEGDAAKAEKQAHKYDVTSSARGSTLLESPVQQGAKLTLALNVPGAAVEDPVQHLVWRGSPESVQFGLTVPAVCKPGNLLGTVSVSDRSVPIGRVKFVLQVVSGRTTVPEQPQHLPESWVRYHHAFISHASQDRAEVLKRVQMLDRTGIDYFHDLLSLDPGDQWERTLYEKIDESDVFFLFWSSAAKSSEWVMKEVRYAMERHRGDDLALPEIVPVLIEGPPPVAPPPELKDLHFNDRFLYFIAGSA